MSVTYEDTVQVWKDFINEKAKEPYMKHTTPNRAKIFDSQFVPFEDFLGVGSDAGFQSICIPGSGQSKFDAYEANLYET